jgi:hypothetical protein
MTDLDFQKTELIEKIMRRALGDLYDWRSPKLMPGIGPQYPQIFQEFEQRRSSYCTKIKELLEAKTVVQLRSEFLRSVGSALNPFLQHNGIYFESVAELDRLCKSRPPWFAGGWCVDRFRLDAEYWGAAHAVTAFEAALMLVGVDPRKVIYDALFDGYGQDNRTDEVLYFLEDQFELIVRKFGDPDEAKVSIPIRELSLWVEREDVSVSYELARIVQRKTKNEASKGRKVGTADANKRVHARTREMFQRALVVAAINAYGLHSKKDAARVARKMVSEGDFLGFRLDAKKLALQIRAGFSQIDKEVVAEFAEKALRK